MELYGIAPADKGIKIFDRRGRLVYGDCFGEGIFYLSISGNQFYGIGAGIGIDMCWVFESGTI